MEVYSFHICLEVYILEGYRQFGEVKNSLGHVSKTDVRQTRVRQYLFLCVCDYHKLSGGFLLGAGQGNAGCQHRDFIILSFRLDQVYETLHALSVIKTSSWNIRFLSSTSTTTIDFMTNP